MQVIKINWEDIIQNSESPEKPGLPEELERILDEITSGAEHDWRFWSNSQFLEAGLNESEIKDLTELFIKNSLGKLTDDEGNRLKSYIKKINSYINKIKEWKEGMR